MTLMERFKSWPWFVKLIAGIGALVLVVFIFDRGSGWWMHYKGWKSDQEYAETIRKSDELSKQSAEHKAKAEQLENLAALKDSQIFELMEQSKRFGSQAAESAKKVDEIYNQLEKDKAVIESMSDAQLQYLICKERFEMGFGNRGQCKDWKP